MTVDSVNETNMISPTSSQFSPRSQCFVRVRIIEILLRRPWANPEYPSEPSNEVATWSCSSLSSPTPSWSSGRGSSSWRAGYGRSQFKTPFQRRSKFPKLKEGPRAHKLSVFFYRHKCWSLKPYWVEFLNWQHYYFELWQQIFWRSWRKYLRQSATFPSQLWPLHQNDILGVCKLSLQGQTRY